MVKVAEYTQDALDRLDATIVEYERRLAEAQLSLGSGASDGNNTWHDNPAFEQAKADVDQWTTELRKLKARRTDAVVVQTGSANGVIGVGSYVTVLYSGDDAPMELHLSGEHIVSRNSEGVMEVSSTSPIGAALMGHKSGEVTQFDLPRGGATQVTILSVS